MAFCTSHGRLSRALPERPGRTVARRGRLAGRPAVLAGGDPAALLDAFDRQRQVDAAGRLVAHHLTLGYPAQDVMAILAHALLREDASFHGYQMLEAGIRQFQEWGNTGEGRHILVAVARYLAAHSPTERAVFQTADIARRLLRGGELYENSNASGNRPSPGPNESPRRRLG